MKRRSGSTRKRGASRRQRGGSQTFFEGGAAARWRDFSGPAVLVAYHIYCNAHTKSILLNQCMNLMFSGLYRRANKVLCFLTGEEGHLRDVKTILGQMGKKFYVMAEGPNDRSYERFTLLRLHEILKPDDKVLYIHTKGVTRPTSLPVFWWRVWMEWYLMRNHERCLRELEHNDVVSVGYRIDSGFPVPPHFSGNFWWARGDYYLSLPKMIGARYLDPEMYVTQGVGGNAPRVKDLWDGKRGKDVRSTDYYHYPVLPREYVDDAHL